MRRIAIACAGGGSHTAFTAGALTAILRKLKDRTDCRIVALSGTSGGAICALLAWYGILIDGGATGIETLRAFWTTGYPNGNAATLPFDWMSNQMLVAAARAPMKSEVNPYAVDHLLRLFPPAAQERLRPWLDAQSALRNLLTRHVAFDRLAALRDRPGVPELLIGAVEVLTGKFVCFKGSDKDFSVNCVIASCTLPELMTGLSIGNGVYWDGLFSHNPPIGPILDLGKDDADAKPDEIWTIRINPRGRDAEPQRLHDIVDRRNELSGNLSLEHELLTIGKINEMLDKRDESVTLCREAQGEDAADRLRALPLFRFLESYRTIRVRDGADGIEMDPEVARGLDYGSKLRRDPEFIHTLMAQGEARAEAFLDKALK